MGAFRLVFFFWLVGFTCDMMCNDAVGNSVWNITLMILREMILWVFISQLLIVRLFVKISF